LQSKLLSSEDIITPQGVSLWPLAFGWWALILVSILAIVAVIIFYRQYKKKWAYRREALALLNKYRKSSSTSDIAIKYLECLKRVAITAYPNKNIDSLHGEAWLIFLNQQTPKPLFNGELETFILTSQYKKIFTLQNENLYTAVESWIKKHSKIYPAKYNQSIEGGKI
jgi:hypothetical protein